MLHMFVCCVSVYVNECNSFENVLEYQYITDTFVFLGGAYVCAEYQYITVLHICLCCVSVYVCAAVLVYMFVLC